MLQWPLKRCIQSFAHASKFEVSQLINFNCFHKKDDALLVLRVCLGVVDHVHLDVSVRRRRSFVEESILASSQLQRVRRRLDVVQEAFVARQQLILL